MCRSNRIQNAKSRERRKQGEVLVDWKRAAPVRGCSRKGWKAHAGNQKGPRRRKQAHGATLKDYLRESRTLARGGSVPRRKKKKRREKSAGTFLLKASHRSLCSKRTVTWLSYEAKKGIGF